jgi:hypothetical protein
MSGVLIPAAILQALQFAVHIHIIGRTFQISRPSDDRSAAAKNFPSRGRFTIVKLAPRIIDFDIALRRRPICIDDDIQSGILLAKG